MKPRVAITIGDFNGIGPEIIIKSLAVPSVQKSITPLLIGSHEVFSHYSRALKFKKKLVQIDTPDASVQAGEIPVLSVSSATLKNIQYGRVAPDAGVCAGLAIEKAVQLCLKGHVQAMVTAPISKESLHLAGYGFPGQTEMLALLSRSEKVAMMLVSPQMRIGLATIHCSLSEVSRQITIERILDKLTILHQSLQKDFKIKNPSIAVLALNPHSGENGSMGEEENTKIKPAIQEARAKGINAVGPFPADGFFATFNPKTYDAVLAMYHDQGLIPIKMIAFREGINYSAGLQIIRTSPDHGTAFEIAGTGAADPSSMIAAIHLAKTIVLNRMG